MITKDQAAQWLDSESAKTETPEVPPIFDGPGFDLSLGKTPVQQTDTSLESNQPATMELTPPGELHNGLEFAGPDKKSLYDFLNSTEDDAIAARREHAAPLLEAYMNGMDLPDEWMHQLVRDAYAGRSDWDVFKDTAKGIGAGLYAMSSEPKEQILKPI